MSRNPRRYPCSICRRATSGYLATATNQNVIAPTNVCFLATGNNVQFKGDVTTRVLLCEIDPKTERPEEREFEGERRLEERSELRKDVGGDLVDELVRVAERREQEVAGARLGEAVAASAAVPGIFEPISLAGIYPKEGDPYDVRLVDGGVYDNQGFDPVRIRSGVSQGVAAAHGQAHEHELL